MKRLFQTAVSVILALSAFAPAAAPVQVSFAQGGVTQPGGGATQPAPGAPSAGVAPAAGPGLAAAAGAPGVAYHAVTGKVRFMSAPAGRALSYAPNFAPGGSPEAAARAFFDQHGADFGLNNPAQELRARRTVDLEPDLSAVRFQQVYRGVPVFGGELIAQVDAAGGTRLAAGEVAPDLNLSVTPRLPAHQAADAAVEYVAKHYGYDPATLRAAAPQLWIYNPALLDARGPNLNRLVWRTEVTSTQRADLRELALVDADRGGILLNFNQVDDLLNRRIHDNNNNPALGLPGGGPVRTEGGGASGVLDADNAYDYAGATYNFYLTTHGRDSLDNAGLQLVQTVRYCPDAASCPFANAQWNGEQMLYGAGYASADDVVAHEMTHGVTQYESGLFYWMQSGAINEAFSDIWGEIIDLESTNSLDDDSNGVKWQMGEDLPIGAIRLMSNPPAFNHPDRMGSANFYCGYSDRGGVHSNSGVANKAAFLMVDGGVFNGYTINPIGRIKTAHIFYRAQTGLLNAASDYGDLNDALAYACSSLVGRHGITSNDCAEVNKALAATQMGMPATSCATPDARVCEVPDFNSAFNGGIDGWSTQRGAWSPDADSYNVTGVANEWNSISHPINTQDFTFQAVMRRSGCATCANSLIVHGSPGSVSAEGFWDAGYLLSYTNSGQFSVYKFNPSGAPTALRNWSSAPAVLAGDWNTLKLVSQEDYLRFYINNTLVWSSAEGVEHTRAVGLAMYSDVTGGGNLLEVLSARSDGGTPLVFYRETFEGGLGAWASSATTGLANWQLLSIGYATSGIKSMYAFNPATASDYNLAGPGVALPPGKTSFLRFNHYFATESLFDGGVVEYSANGGPWTDAGPLFTDTGYTATLNAGNPLGARPAFTGNYKGYVSSRLDLTSLAGANVRFRFRFASDSSSAVDGWYLDDPTLYTCAGFTMKLPFARR